MRGLDLVQACPFSGCHTRTQVTGNFLACRVGNSFQVLTGRRTDIVEDRHLPNRSNEFGIDIFRQAPCCIFSVFSLDYRDGRRHASVQFHKPLVCLAIMRDVGIPYGCGIP